MNKSALAVELKRVAYLTGQFRLRAGKPSSFYWDKYRFESNPQLLKAVAEHVEKLLPEDFDRIAALELGGVPVGVALSLRTGKPCLFVHKAPKNYGTCNLVEGEFNPGETVVVVEDVVTTAGQVCRLVRQMRELGLIVENVVCVIDRRQGGAENLSDIGCTLSPIFTPEDFAANAASGG